jgi:hypothetical protein
MKLKIFFFIVSTFFVQTAIAQSVVVTSKKVTYTRPKPLSDDKKTFTINYPKVKAANTALSKKIETSISLEKNLAFRLTDEMGADQWLEEADYKVSYNKKGVLCIGLSVTGTGAFQSSFYKNVVVDLKTGKKAQPVEVFTNLKGLIVIIKKIQQAEIKQGIEEIKKDAEYGSENTVELFKYADFKVLNLESFSVDAAGVTFYYDYGFPRLIRAIQPAGNYFLSWAELKPYLKRRGLLGKFVK